MVMLNFGKTVINNANIGFKGNNALVWQRQFKKGLLSSGQIFRFYYNTTTSNGNNLFEIEIWKDGSKITTNGQLVHAKNTRRCCEMVAVFDPLSDYLIKVISKTTATVVLQSIQIKGYSTEIDANGVEQISYSQKGSVTITGTNNSYALSDSISYGKTFVDTPLVNVTPVLAGDVKVPYIQSISTTTVQIGIQTNNMTNFSNANVVHYRVSGPLVSPALI